MAKITSGVGVCDSTSPRLYVLPLVVATLPEPRCTLELSLPRSRSLYTPFLHIHYILAYSCMFLRSYIFSHTLAYSYIFVHISSINCIAEKIWRMCGYLMCSDLCGFVHRRVGQVLQELLFHDSGDSLLWTQATACWIQATACCGRRRQPAVDVAVSPPSKLGGLRGYVPVP